MRNLAPNRHAAAKLELAQILSGGVVFGALLVLLLAGPFAASRAVVLSAMLVGGVAWMLAVWTAARGAGRLAVILPLALAMRLAALGGELGLSDDLWRYGWEGGLVLEGKSPYAQAPDSPNLANERERWASVFERMNNKEVSAAYPPVTQYFTAAVVAVVGLEGRSDAAATRLERSLRVAFSFIDLLVLIPLFGLLRRRGLPLGMLVVWAWSPLVVWEFASSAHFDSLGILGLLLAVWALATHPSKPEEAGVLKSGLGGVALSLALMTKYLPVIAAPFLLWRGRLSRTLAAALSFVITTVLGFGSLLLLEGGLEGVFSGLGEYGLRWESWNLVYRWIEPLFDSFGDRGEGFADPRRLGRLAVGALSLIYILWLFVRSFEPVMAIFLTLAAFLILTPTLHPWYVTWILPFCALAPRGTARAWLWLAAASPLLYWPLVGWQARGEWLEPSWSWPVVALPFFLLLGFDFISWRRSVMEH